MSKFIQHSILFETTGAHSKNPKTITRVSMTISDYKKIMKKMLDDEQYKHFLNDLVTIQENIRNNKEEIVS
jgi:hypothetical protein